MHSRRCIDRVLFHHRSGRRDYHRPPSDDCLGSNWSRLFYYDTGGGSVLVCVSFTLIGRTARIGRYRQVGGHCRRGKG
jgi:hypothetical protein